MRPVVGITSYAQEASWGVWQLPAALVPLAYVDAIERAGGRAVVIPPAEEDIEETLDALDAIVFSGGADVDPLTVRRRRASRDGHAADPSRRRRAGAPHAALERDMPTLAICRGVQLLNVARGGDLIQHLPEQVGNDVHKQVPGRVRGASGGGQGGLAARRRSSARGSDVTSHHHQALGRVGDGPRRDRVGRRRHARGGRGSDAALRRRCAVAPGGGRGRGALRGAGRAGSRVPRGAHAVGSHLPSRQEERVYFAFAAIYVVLSIVFIVDVLRQPSTALSGVGQGALDPRAPRRARASRGSSTAFWRIRRVAPVELAP